MRATAEILLFSDISIHSLRMEGDPMRDMVKLYDVVISIHSLRMEGDLPHSTP